MKKHIPNLITCMNVTSGTVAIYAAFHGHLYLAAWLVILAMVFDFFDGFAARLLHVKSEMGKELDSLADMVSFGVMPSVMAFFLIRDLGYSGGELFAVNSWQGCLCTCRFWFRLSRLIAWLSSIWMCDKLIRLSACRPRRTLCFG